MLLEGARIGALIWRMPVEKIALPFVGFEPQTIAAKPIRTQTVRNRQIEINRKIADGPATRHDCDIPYESRRNPRDLQGTLEMQSKQRPNNVTRTGTEKMAVLGAHSLRSGL
jgi:hypothetical protein